MHLPTVKLVHWSVLSGFHLIGQGLPVSNISPATGAVGRTTALTQPTRRAREATLEEVENMGVSLVLLDSLSERCVWEKIPYSLCFYN